MEIPTARVMKKDTFRIGYSQINPYKYYYGALSPFKDLEIDGRVTQIIGVPGFDENTQYASSYGDYKDKTIDIKYKLLSEDKYMPAIALGIMDPQGTRIYASQYVVLSKQIYPFDFSVGFGNGRFGKKPLPGIGEKIKIEMLTDTRNWINDSQFFWGIQFAPSEKYALMAEFNPIQYDKQNLDPARRKYFDAPIPLNYNFGLRLKPFEDFAKESEIAMSFQRGHMFGINFSVPFEIGKPFIPLYISTYKEAPGNPNWRNRIELALLFSRFSDLGIRVEGKTLIIDLQNTIYYYNITALLVALKTIAPMVPEEIDDITIIFKEFGIPIFSFHTNRADLLDFKTGILSSNEFFRISQYETKNLYVPKSEKKFKPQDTYIYGWKPHFNLYLNDPSKFFQGKLGALGWVGYVPWSGGSLIAGMGFFPFSSIKSSTEPLSNAVRSDLTNYSNNVTFDNFLFQQINRFNPEFYSRMAVGILELQYAGLDMEVAKPFFDGRLLAGLSGSIVKKRDPENPLLLKKNNPRESYNTSFVNTRINLFEYGTSFEVNYGKFLAGDVGSRFTVSKNINGVTISLWYSFTDTSKFSDNINQGYHDKGIELKIPLRLFIGKDTKTVFPHRMSPWTRDVAQDINHFSSLFDEIEKNSKLSFEREKSDSVKYK